MTIDARAVIESCHRDWRGFWPRGFADDFEARLKAAGFAIVPVVPTREMLNAAIDVDSFKLGDISPLGFRCSPQQLFNLCYRAMLAASWGKS